ncbi:Ribosome-recycling factor [Euphorbia peplus]|nr:Ribosome-recycling factor [Euphorbia peplus]
MATPFSSTNLRSNPTPLKTLLYLPGSFSFRVSSSVKTPSYNAAARSWTASSSYSVTLKLSGHSTPLLHTRRVAVRCATMEEIEAEKSSIEKDAKARMEKTIETIRTNFNSVRTGRANPAMLDKIEVDYYGSPVGLKTIAQISTPDAGSLLVQPYDKSSLKSIEKAIVSSDLGMTPNNDGEVIRLSVPQLTSDRRKEMSKMVAKLTEEGKVALRNIRRDALKAYDKLQKEKKLSEDNVKDLSGDLQKLIDEYMKKVDVIYKQKEKELLKVALRNIRRDALKAYDKPQKEKKLSEDNVKDLSGDLQKLIDEYMKKVDVIYKQKEKELLKV